MIMMAEEGRVGGFTWNPGKPHTHRLELERRKEPGEMFLNETHWAPDCIVRLWFTVGAPTSRLNILALLYFLRISLDFSQHVFFTS